MVALDLPLILTCFLIISSIGSCGALLVGSPTWTSVFGVRYLNVFLFHEERY
jgi:hypothetical protein